MMYGCDAAMSVMCDSNTWTVFILLMGSYWKIGSHVRVVNPTATGKNILKYFAEPLLIQEDKILTMTPECPINNLKMFNRFLQYDFSHPYLLTYCSHVS